MTNCSLQDANVMKLKLKTQSQWTSKIQTGTPLIFSVLAKSLHIFI